MLFRCNRLPPSFLSSYSPGGFSVDDGHVNKIIDFGENNSGTIKLGLTLKRGKVTFRVEPLPGELILRSELVLTNNSKCHGVGFKIRLGRKAFTVRYGVNRLFIIGRSNDSDREMLRYTSSLVSLTSETIITILNPPTISLNFYWSPPKGYTEKLVPENKLAVVWQQIIDALSAGSSQILGHRYNEISFLVAGFNQNLLLEDRLTNLYKALESFDGTKTLSPNRLSEIFDVTKDDAKFICELRNGLIHKGMTIHEAAIYARDKLVSIPNVSLKKFKNIGSGQMMPWRIYVTLSRMIVSAYFRELGIDKPAQIFSRFRGY